MKEETEMVHSVCRKFRYHTKQHKKQLGNKSLHKTSMFANLWSVVILVAFFLVAIDDYWPKAEDYNIKFSSKRKNHYCVCD